MSTFEQLVESHHVIDFEASVAVALQQMGPKLRQFVMEKDCKGSEQSVQINLFDRVETSRRTGRKPENIDNRANRRRRWLVYQDPFETGEYIDEVDIWRQAFDPTSNLMQTHAQAVGRAIDQIILEGLTGAAYEGKRGETTVNLPSAQKVGIQVGSGDTPADVGLNLIKLREARKVLEKAHVDLDREELFIALSTDEHDALIGFVEATSGDFQNWDANLRPVYRTGRIAQFMGFNLIRHQELRTNTAGTIRYLPVWTRSALTLGVWLDVRPRMGNDSSRQNTPWFNIDFAGDARRSQDGYVVEIACKV